MTLALWCVLAAGLLPLVWVGYAKINGGSYDNQAPRQFLAGVEGAAKRAHWAEQNAYEAFPLFAAGVLIAHYLDAPAATVDTLALAFVMARVAHGILYIADLATLRSLAWLVGWGCSIALYIVSATA